MPDTTSGNFETSSRLKIDVAASPATGPIAAATTVSWGDAVWEWAQAVLLIANLGWTVLCLGGFRAATMVVTSVLTGVLLLTHAAAWLVVRVPHRAEADGGGGDPAGSSRRAFHPAGYWFIPFLVYAAANVAWVTPVRWLGWSDWFGWAQMIAVFWVMLNGVRSRAPRLAVFGALLAVAVTAVGMGCYQRFVAPHWLMLHRIQADQYIGRASGCFGIPNSLAALLLLILPVTGAIACRPRATAVLRVFFGWLTVVFLFGLGLTISRGAWLGLALALAAWPVLTGGASWRRRLAMAGLVLAGVGCAGALAGIASPQIRGRFAQLVRDEGERSRPILWRAGLNLVRGRPWTGTGGGSFNALFERYRPEGFLNEPLWAHNDYLNTLSDYGAIGFVLFFGAAAVVAGRTVGRVRTTRPARSGGGATTPPGGRGSGAFEHPLVRSALAIGLLAFALQLFVDFHFKIAGLALSFAIVAGLAVSGGWTAPARPRTGVAKHLDFAVALAIAGVAVAFSGLQAPRFAGEGHREDARDIIDHLGDRALDPAEMKAKLTAARADLDEAVRYAPDNAQAWSDRAYAAALWSRLNPTQTVELGRAAEADANRALAISPVLAESWIRRGVARDMQGNWVEAGNDFVHAISLSPKSVLPWFHYGYHLSLHPAELELAKAMVAFCLRLDPANPDALRLRQQLATSGPRP
ncbi:MAG TPA: O-antigen ligase family protein [Opitutaceae bacterium]|nr:O-antigen ligase family protein [Opitutaceae bacterium]